MTPASRSLRRRAAGVAIVAAISAAAGWSLGDGAHDPPAAAATRGGRPYDGFEAPAAIAGSTGSGGRDYAPEVRPDWADAAETGETPCESHGDDPQAVDQEALERMLANGAEPERHEALMGALEAAADLPPQLLWQVYGYDPSERVRLLAYQAYLDAKAAEPAELRVALQSGVSDASPVIQAEARLRLGELDAYEFARAQVSPGELR